MRLFHRLGDRSPKFMMYYCICAIGGYVCYEGYIDCSDTFEINGWLGCLDSMILSMFQFLAILATIILGGIIGVGMAMKYRGQ